MCERFLYTKDETKSLGKEGIYRFKRRNRKIMLGFSWFWFGFGLVWV